MDTAATPRSVFRVKTVLGLSFGITLGLCGLFIAHAFATDKAQQTQQAPELADVQAAFEQRQRAVVSVEGIVRNEVDRDVVRGLGLVIDAEGRIVLQDGFLPSWVPPSRFGDFKVRLPGEDGDGVAADYLGQDYLSGWHYLQVRDVAKRATFVPITEFGRGDARIGDTLWGIGIMGEGWNSLPYYMSSTMSLKIALPWLMGFTTEPVASPGSAVFDRSGRFAGWAAAPRTEEQLLFMQQQHFRVAVQSVNRSGSFITAETFYRFIERVPQSVQGDARPWLGVSGLQPLDREVAEIMGLKGQGALVISDVIEGSPAAAAGLQGRDIVVGLDGERLPNMQPSFILSQWMEFQLMSKQSGEQVRLNLLRGGKPVEAVATMGTEPTTLKRAEREYYARLGLTIRAFTLFDGIAKRTMSAQAPGVIADFVRPNGSVDSGGLEPGDWILAVNGTDVTDFDSARKLLSAIEADTAREELVLLVKRNNETKVLRIKLH